MIFNNPRPTSQQIKLFESEINSILVYVAKSYVTFQQIYLIYYESNIKFLNDQEKNKIKQLFTNNQVLPLRECFSIIQLHSCVIIHNRPVFYVIVSKVSRHVEKECFQFWKELMKTKYGTKMRWFDEITGKQESRRIKSYEFKIKINSLLKGTPHQACGESICLKFTKNKKNEIEWGIFMSVVRFNEGGENNRVKAGTIESNKNESIEQKKEQKWEQVRGRISTPKRCSTRNLRISSQKYQNLDKNRMKNKEGEENNHSFFNKSSIQINQQYHNITQKFRSIGQYAYKKSLNLRVNSAKRNSFYRNTRSVNKTQENFVSLASKTDWGWEKLQELSRKEKGKIGDQQQIPSQRKLVKCREKWKGKTEISYIQDDF